jgi:predicted ATP-grasp superfamily ATP-dependent carboligase
VDFFINYLFLNNLDDENKVIKLNLDNSDSLIKECAKVQTQQQKMIKQLKEQFSHKNEEIEKVIKLKKLK